MDVLNDVTSVGGSLAGGASSAGGGILSTVTSAGASIEQTAVAAVTSEGMALASAAVEDVAGAVAAYYWPKLLTFLADLVAKWVVLAGEMMVLGIFSFVVFGWVTGFIFCCLPCLICRSRRRHLETRHIYRHPELGRQIHQPGHENYLSKFEVWKVFGTSGVHYFGGWVPNLVGEARLGAYEAMRVVREDIPVAIPIPPLVWLHRDPDLRSRAAMSERIQSLDAQKTLEHLIERARAHNIGGRDSLIEQYLSKPVDELEKGFNHASVEVEPPEGEMDERAPPHKLKRD